MISYYKLHTRFGYHLELFLILDFRKISLIISCILELNFQYTIFLIQQALLEENLPKLLRMEDMTNPIEGDMRAFTSVLSSEISLVFFTFIISDLRLTHPSFSPFLFETKRTWTQFSVFSHFT